MAFGWLEFRLCLVEVNNCIFCLLFELQPGGKQSENMLLRKIKQHSHEGQVYEMWPLIFGIFFKKDLYIGFVELSSGFEILK